MKRLFCVLFVTMFALTLFSACSTSSSEKPSPDTSAPVSPISPSSVVPPTEETPPVATKKGTIKIGTMATNLDSVNTGIPSLENMGYTVEIVTFDDITMPNTALLEGAIDVNY